MMGFSQEAWLVIWPSHVYSIEVSIFVLFGSYTKYLTAREPVSSLCCYLTFLLYPYNFEQILKHHKIFVIACFSYPLPHDSTPCWAQFLLKTPLIAPIKGKDISQANLLFPRQQQIPASWKQNSRRSSFWFLYHKLVSCFGLMEIINCDFFYFFYLGMNTSENKEIWIRWWGGMIYVGQSHASYPLFYMLSTLNTLCSSVGCWRLTNDITAQVKDGWVQI